MPRLPFPALPHSLISLRLLIIPTAISFIPQYRLILSRKDCEGISFAYVFFNLLSATEQFAFGLYISVPHFDHGGESLHRPPDLQSWTNICQLAVVWVCHLA